MKNYVVILVQIIVWSGYTYTRWLSKHDQLLYEMLMFLVFLYLAIIFGQYVLKSMRKTLLITLVSLTSYTLVQMGLNYL